MSRTLPFRLLAPAAVSALVLALSRTALWPARLDWLAWFAVGGGSGWLLASWNHAPAGHRLFGSLTPLIETDATGHVIGVNSSAAALFGAPAASLAGQRVQIGEDIAWPERLAAITEVTRGIAHELRNPLTAVRNAAQLGLMFADPDKKDNLFREVIAGADRLNGSIDDLTEFTVPNPKPLMPVRLDQVVAAALAQVKGILIMHGIKVDCVFTGRLPLVHGDERQLKQALLSIFHNAIRAMPSGGTLSIRTLCRTAEGRLELLIGDTGPGIAPQAVPRMFRPFSGSQGSSGLGLTIASQIIVQRHNGAISCQSSIGGGTRVRVLLPVCEGRSSGRHDRLSADNL